MASVLTFTLIGSWVSGKERGKDKDWTDRLSQPGTSRLLPHKPGMTADCA